MEKLPADPPVIHGVSTSTAGFVGQTERGSQAPELVTSWSEFQQLFGAARDASVSFLPYAVRGYFENGGQRAYIARITPPTDGSPLRAVHYVGDLDAALDQRRGLAALEGIGEVSLLCVPDEVHPSLSPTDQAELTQAIVDQCEDRADRFAILQVGPGRSDFHVLQPPRDTRDAALYFPWIRVPDGSIGEPLLIPPGGHVAGVFARTDREGGVHKAPTGVVGGLAPGASTAGLQSLEFTLTPDQHESLNSRGINTLREFADGSVRVWGARTLSQDPEWRFVQVRRLLLFILESTEEGIQWAVFEPSDEPLWAKVRASISSFLSRVWRAGALIGRQQEEAFFVKCDRTTMTQDDIDRGRLSIIVGVAPLQPAEFIIVRIEQMVRPPSD